MYGTSYHPMANIGSLPQNGKFLVVLGDSGEVHVGGRILEFQQLGIVLRDQKLSDPFQSRGQVGGQADLVPPPSQFSTFSAISAAQCTQRASLEVLTTLIGLEERLDDKMGLKDGRTGKIILPKEPIYAKPLPLQPKIALFGNLGP